MSDKVKICMIGATGVGKTSLVSRFVRSIFTETYATTIGVKIETREVRRADRTIQATIWDLSGEDEFQNVQPIYLRGAGGFLVVMDGTRPGTIETALAREGRLRRERGDAPFVAVLNKADLVADWAVRPADIEALKRRGWTIVQTSAKTGAGVEEAFRTLVEAILSSRGKPWR